MNQRRIFHCQRTIGLALMLTSTVLAVGCVVTPQADAGDPVGDEIATVEAIPILVTLVADEGIALAAARERLLARLRSVMSERTFADIRTYDALPIVAVPATPKILALLLTLPDVRSVEADRSFESL